MFIEHVTLISPDKDRLYPKSSILIQGDSILFAGQQQIRISGTYRSIDGKNKYLIPGLIDSHVHISNVPGMGSEQEKVHPGLAAA